MIKDETFAKIAHMDWMELSHAYEELRKENAALKRDKDDAYTATAVWIKKNAKLKRENEALREYIEAEGELPMRYETQEAAEKSYELKKKMDALLTGEQDDDE